MADHLERLARIETVKNEHAVHCGALSYNSGADNFKIHWDQALQLQLKLKRALFPWMKFDDRQSEIRRMSDAWQKAYGKLNDPETQAKIHEAVKILLSRNKQKRNGLAWR